MRKILITVFFMCFLFVFNSVETYSQEDVKPAEKTDFLKELGFEMLDFPGSERSKLEIPDFLWDYVKEKVGFKGEKLGFTSEEMEHFKSDEHRIPVVERLFRD
ncbi:MAG: hypothetical protein K8S87_01415 [Planctomycetes bacterium]|nr:hypothetical protein [Planctomycetota bacterium]